MWSMERGLVRDDFEDGVAVGDVQESVGAEHGTQQAAAPAVEVDAGHTGLGEVRAAENNAANPDSAEVYEEQIVVVVYGHNVRPARRPDEAIEFAPPLLSVQMLKMSASPARARGWRLMLRATKVIYLPVKTGGHSTNPPVQ